ncbi:MAG: VTT domain-containing protein [Firmicutes bacterium]|nr:VTT domain-containing protein [Bacillota bacterium]
MLGLTGVALANNDWLTFGRQLLLASAGSFIGFTLAYAFGRFAGRPLLLRILGFFGLSDRQWQLSERYFRHYGLWLLLFGRYLYGIRHLVPYLAGILQIRWPLLMAYNAAGTLLWVTPLLVLGRIVGSRFPALWSTVHHASTPIGIALLTSTLVSLLGSLWFRRHQRAQTETRG